MSYTFDAHDYLFRRYLAEAFRSLKVRVPLRIFVIYKVMGLEFCYFYRQIVRSSFMEFLERSKGATP
jgi:hypothetical protein